LSAPGRSRNPNASEQTTTGRPIQPEQRNTFIAFIILRASFDHCGPLLSESISGLSPQRVFMSLSLVTKESKSSQKDGMTIFEPPFSINLHFAISNFQFPIPACPG
jgi:hypothetical protein